MDKPDKEALAKIILNQALKDMLNDQGRIILSELRRDINMPNLTADNIIEAWKQQYPDYVIEQRTENVILIQLPRTLTRKKQ